MPHSIKAKLSGLRHKGYITDAEYDRLKNAIDNEQKWIPSDKELPREGEDVLDKIKDEIIERFASSNCAEESGCLDQLLEIIDKYREGEQE